jgi:para-aminobenzoate synthetase component 2
VNILLIDNNDSFTYNLEHVLVAITGTTPRIAPYEALTRYELSEFQLVVVSPGPGRPSAYPDYRYLLEQTIPVLGICLGMQIINDYFGGETRPLPDCVHGRAVGRYHSLYVRKVGAGLDVTCRNRDGIPMVLRHHSRPLLGYQFHPESFLTSAGEFLIEYALTTLGLSRSRDLSGHLPRTG